MRLLLFGGTTEGRQVAAKLAKLGYALTVCVATEYGAALLTEIPGIELRVGRLDGAAMLSLMHQGGYACVVDATHPYAVAVTQNIVWAGEQAGLPYYRLCRPLTIEPDMEQDVKFAADSSEAAELLGNLPKKANILLTTGTKDLRHFIHLNEPDRRLYVRVLPSLESLEICLKAGLPQAQVICMQGPFSEELNVALMRQFQIGLMVTKVAGKAGGFEEKVRAARSVGAGLLVIQPPCEEHGWDQKELLREIQTRWQEGEKDEA